MGKKNKKSKGKIVVFTGVSQLAGLAQYPYVAEVISGLRARAFISGGAPGIDTMAAVEAKRQFPKAQHVVVKPYGYKINDVHFAWCRQQRFDVIELERSQGRRQGQGGSHPNIVRNQFMIDMAVALADEYGTEPVLVAFPGSPKEVLRSGTWSTIRRARAADMKVLLNPLSEANGSMIGGQIER
jgi:hypothetical protein